MANSPAIQAATDYIEANKERFREELFQFLRIAGISAQTDHARDIRAAAEWTKNRCQAAGLTAQIVQTPGWPVVLAEGTQQPGRPTILIYGHYDVQPEGDLSLWHTGPFDPVMRDGKITCRGAADDKGQLFCAIAAVEAWMKTAGSLPVNIKLCIEGEEEIGSPHLAAVVETHREQLACDYVVIHDTAQFGDDAPAITTATKGLVYKEVIIRGPGKDLHSGSFGGTIANPANELASLLASLKDADGKVLIPGFYDNVEEMSSTEADMMRSLPFDEIAYLNDLGSPKLHVEKGYSALHARWARPTLDVNGIFGGYMKEGASTIIPSTAGAKISMRLVPNQKAADIESLFEEAVRARVPDTVRLEIKSHANCDPYMADLQSAGMVAAREALEIGFGKSPFMIREGGSLPILPMFKSILGADSLLIGFCQPNCNAHSPNEFLHARDFEGGMRTSAALMGLLTA